MISVIDVDISEHLRLSDHRVGMVAAQPFLHLTAEPFRCVEESRAQQLATLERTLEIAVGTDHGAERTHFTLIPEYSIPGLEGVAAIEGFLADNAWPRGTVVVGGTDALIRDEYAELCRQENSATDLEHNGPDRVGERQWVNCCITWVKGLDGAVRRWLQPKIAPAWPEQNITHGDMFRGNSVFLFRCAFGNGAPCRFFSLVCFDWVAVVDGEPIPRQVLDAIAAAGNEVTLSWVFVLQHNEHPSHASFLSRTADFFENQAPVHVHRYRCGVVFVNTAGRAKPGRAPGHGCTALVLSPVSPFALAGSHPTYSGNPRSLRGSDALSRCRDTIFREKGACIHSFSQNVPAAAHLGAGGRALPLHRAHVHPLAVAPGGDPRTPGSDVPCCVKWVNDSLDEVPCLGKQLPAAPLAESIIPIHDDNVGNLRSLESARLQNAIECATWRPPDTPAPMADDWHTEQATALEHLVHTLDILGIGEAVLDFTEVATHATARLGGHLLEVLVVTGPSHDDCVKHAGQHFVPVRRRQVLLVTKDPHNTPLLKRHGSFLKPSVNRALGDEVSIIDPTGTRLHTAFDELLQSYLAAPTAASLAEALNAALAP